MPDDTIIHRHQQLAHVVCIYLFFSLTGLVKFLATSDIIIVCIEIRHFVLAQFNCVMCKHDG